MNKRGQTWGTGRRCRCTRTWRGWRLGCAPRPSSRSSAAARRTRSGSAHSCIATRVYGIIEQILLCLKLTTGWPIRSATISCWIWFGCFTVCLIVLGQLQIWQNCMVCMHMVELPNQSQRNVVSDLMRHPVRLLCPAYKVHDNEAFSDIESICQSAKLHSKC